jgi:hypothetical protein
MSDEETKVLVCSPATDELLALEWNEPGNCAHCNRDIVISQEGALLGAAAICTRCVLELPDADEAPGETTEEIRRRVREQAGEELGDAILQMSAQASVRTIAAMVEANYEAAQERKRWKRS